MQSKSLYIIDYIKNFRQCLYSFMVKKYKNSIFHYKSLFRPFITEKTNKLKRNSRLRRRNYLSIVRHSTLPITVILPLWYISPPSCHI